MCLKTTTTTKTKLKSVVIHYSHYIDITLVFNVINTTKKQPNHSKMIHRKTKYHNVPSNNYQNKQFFCNIVNSPK